EGLVNMRKVKVRTYEILTISPVNDKVGKGVDLFLITLISLNIIAVLLEVIGIIQKTSWLFIFEYVSITLFTCEYILRTWCCTMNSTYQHSIKGRLRYMLTPLA